MTSLPPLSVDVLPPSRARAPPADAAPPAKRRRPKRHGGAAAAAAASPPPSAPSSASAAAAPGEVKWGSKQPKPPDAEITSYLLTAGGELARRAQKQAASEEVDEEAKAMRANMLKEISNGEASLSCHERASRVLQGLIKNCTPEELFPLFTRLKPYIGHLVYDKYASHVIQDLLASVIKMSSESALVDLVDQFGAEVNKANEWWPLMHDASGSHSARALVTSLHALGLTKQLEGLSQSLLKASLSDLRGATKDPYAGGFLAVALPALQPAQCEAVLSRLLSLEKSDPVAFETVVSDKVASHLLDCSLDACSPEFKRRLFETRFKGNLARLAMHPLANFAVQRILARLDEDAVGLEELEPIFGQLMASSRVGVLVAVVKSARSPVSAERVVKSILACAKGSVAELLAIVQVEDAPDASNPSKASKRARELAVSIPGADLVGAMLDPRIPDSIRLLVVDALVALPREELLRLAMDPVGGRRTLEVALEHGTGAMVSKLARALDGGAFGKLAADKFGCHVVRKLFDHANVKIKTKVASELLASREVLVGSKSGLALLKHCDLDAYKRDAKAWESALANKERKVQTMTEWLEGELV